MTLFEECIQALDNKVEIFTLEETTRIFDELVNTFPVTSWGRIDWEKITTAIRISNLSEIEALLENHFNTDLNTDVILLWNYSSSPAVKTDLSQVIQVIDDVTAVGSDTWIFSPTQRYVIEFFHEGEVILGINQI